MSICARMLTVVCRRCRGIASIGNRAWGWGYFVMFDSIWCTTATISDVRPGLDAGDGERLAQCAGRSDTDARSDHRHRHAHERSHGARLDRAGRRVDRRRSARGRRGQRRARRGAGDAAAVVQFSAPVEFGRLRPCARGAAARHESRSGAGADQRQARAHRRRWSIPIRKIGSGTTPVDFNAIPISAIKRIEVLRDGAGAQYGSDAIAGVINIILDDAPEGGELDGDLRRQPHRLQADRQDRSPTASPASPARKFGTRLGEPASSASVSRSTDHEGDQSRRLRPDSVLRGADAGQSRLAGQAQLRRGRSGNRKLQRLAQQRAAAVRNAPAVLRSARSTARHSIGDNFFRYPDSRGQRCSRSIRTAIGPNRVGSDSDVQTSARLARAISAIGTTTRSLNYGRNAFDYGLRIR